MLLGPPRPTPCAARSAPKHTTGTICDSRTARKTGATGAYLASLRVHLHINSPSSPLPRHRERQAAPNCLQPCSRAPQALPVPSSRAPVPLHLLRRSPASTALPPRHLDQRPDRAASARTGGGRESVEEEPPLSDNSELARPHPRLTGILCDSEMDLTLS